MELSLALEELDQEVASCPGDPDPASGHLSAAEHAKRNRLYVGILYQRLNRLDRKLNGLYIAIIGGLLAIVAGAVGTGVL